MFSKIHYILIFQRKILLPATIISTLLGTVGMSINEEPLITNAGFSYLLILPLFQFFVYELRYPNEYYFYQNLGISRIVLWVACVAHVLVVNIVISLF